MISIFIVVAALIAMLLIYEGVRWLAPNWGTVLSNAAMGFTMLADYLNVLPWGTVLEPKDASFVLFAVTAANGIIRFRGSKMPPMGPS